MENLRQVLLQKDFVMSAEVFPPKKNGMLEGITRALRGLSAIKPDFVSITYGASGTGGDKTADVASIAIDAFDMEAVAHITAVNLTVQKLEEIIQTFKRKNIKNIMVLRGDVTPESCFYDFKHARARFLAEHSLVVQNVRYRGCGTAREFCNGFYRYFHLPFPAKTKPPTMAVNGATSTKPKLPIIVFTSSAATYGLLMKSIADTPSALKAIISVR